MTNLQLKIIRNAVRIRVGRGEEIDDVLADYPRLSTEEAQSIRDGVTGEADG